MCEDVVDCVGNCRDHGSSVQLGIANVSHRCEDETGPVAPRIRLCN